MNTLQKAQNVSPATQSVEESRYIAPEVDIYETPEKYVLMADMPGVGKEGLEVTLEDNTITIIGRRPEYKENNQFAYRESRWFNYRRTFELDPAIDTTKISARMDQGVLRLELPKAEKVKPRRITVSG